MTSYAARSRHLTRSVSRYATKLGWRLPLVALVISCMLPWIGVSPYWAREISLFAIYALIISGLNLSFGYTGQLALGQVAMFACGAYLTGILFDHGIHDLALAIPASIAGAIVVGLISGLPGLRLGQWSLAMVSFFLVLLIPDILTIFKSQTGGQVGIPGIVGVTLFGLTLTANQLYVVILVILALWLALFRNTVLSRYGSIFRVVKQSEPLAQSLGVSVYRMKLLVYTLGAVPAGVAGALFAYEVTYISPASFGFSVAVGIFAGALLGGSESIYGALIGSAIITSIPIISASYESYSLLVYGALLLVGGILLAGGVVSLLRALQARIDTGGANERAESAMPPPGRAGTPLEFPVMSGTTIEADNVTKRFGGVVALDGVSIAAEPGTITGLIGANGSGKTTLLNLLSGFYAPTEGHVRLDGVDISKRPPHKVARLGVSRTFQTPLIPEGLTTLEAITAARMQVKRLSLVAAALRLPNFRKVKREDRLVATDLLEILQMGKLGNQQASSLPLGTRRLLEICRALASSPQVLLLDEPASGLDAGEVKRLATLLRSIRQAGAAVVLVEHNVGLVFDVADSVHVLEFGNVIACGSPDHVRNDPVVAESYMQNRAQVSTKDADPVGANPMGTPQPVETAQHNRVNI